MKCRLIFNESWYNQNGIEKLYRNLSAFLEALLEIRHGCWFGKRRGGGDIKLAVLIKW